MNILLDIFKIFCAACMLMLYDYVGEQDSKFGFWMNTIILLPLLANIENLNKSVLWVFIFSILLFTIVNSDTCRETISRKKNMIINIVCGSCMITCWIIKQLPMYLLLAMILWLCIICVTLFIKEVKINQFIVRLSLTLTVVMCCMIDYINAGEESKYTLISLFMLYGIWLVERKYEEEILNDLNKNTNSCENKNKNKEN